METTNIKKINNIDDIYLKEINKTCILFKHTASGTLFTKIDKNKIDKNKLFKFFTNFNKPMYETLLPNLPTKIYLDCDFNNLTEPQFQEKEKIIIKLNKYLISFLKNKNINTDNIIYLDASREKINKTYKISLHIIINNTFIKNRLILKELIKDFKSYLTDDIFFSDSIDTSVYNTPQLFKCVLSPSKDDNTLLIPFSINDRKITYYNNDYIINNIYDFLVGLYHFENNFIDNKLDYDLNPKNQKIPKNPKIPKNQKIPENSKLLNLNQKNWILNNKYIKNKYIIRNDSIYNNKVNLLRINPSHCDVCNRTHHNENAYCMVTSNSIFFHCGRNPSKGVGIGFWYNNYEKNKIINKDKNNNLNENNKVLNNIIKKMKEYIINLESNYNSLKEEFNLLNNIHNKCNSNIGNSNINKTNVKKYTKDINSEMWQKYYRLGKYIEKGLDDLVEKIRCQWKDGSWNRLKNRGLLIYEYINYINSNNIVNTISMRKIFHKKNYETFSSLL